MITIDENEAGVLELQFRRFSDRDIIRELIRRGRLRQYAANAEFYTEMRGDEHYMETVRHAVLSRVVRAVSDDKTLRPALLLAHTGIMPHKAVLSADIICLAARSKQEDGS